MKPILLVENEKLAESFRDQLKNAGYEAVIIVVKNDTLSYSYTGKAERVLFLLEKLKKVVLDQ